MKFGIESTVELVWFTC